MALTKIKHEMVDQVLLLAKKTTALDHTNNGGFQTLSAWDAAIKDTAGGLVAATGVYTFTESGTFEATGVVSFASNAAGARALKVLHSADGSIWEAVIPPSSIHVSIPFAAGFRATAGQNIRLDAYQNSGGNLAYFVGDGYVRWCIKKIGPY